MGGEEGQQHDHNRGQHGEEGSGGEVQYETEPCTAAELRKVSGGGVLQGQPVMKQLSSGKLQVIKINKLKVKKAQKSKVFKRNI